MWQREGNVQVIQGLFSERRVSSWIKIFVDLVDSGGGAEAFTLSF